LGLAGRGDGNGGWEMGGEEERGGESRLSGVDRCLRILLADAAFTKLLDFILLLK